MKLYIDELPVSCSKCPLVIKYDTDYAECILFKNEWKPLIHEYNDDKTLRSCRLADCQLKVISKKDIMSDDSIKEDFNITDNYNDADLLSEEEIENLFKDL